MQEPIRVLHVLQRMEAAGVQTLLMNLYKHIDRNKVQFDFLVHYKEKQFFDEEIEKLGGRIYRLSFREDFNLFKYCNDLDEFFKSHKEYKIVHGHMHSLGAIYLFYAKKYGVPVRIAHSHTNSTQNDKKKYLKLFMNHNYAKYATDLFACSSDAGKYMFGNKDFTIINNAIDSDCFVFSMSKRTKKRRELNIENNMVIGNIGRFEMQKNHVFLLEIFKKFHEYHNNAVLLFIGSGSLENMIKEKVRSMDLSNSVLFLGNRKDVPELLMCMDAFLFPSLFEGLGIVAVESQAAGTPVICTDSLPKEISVSNLLIRVSLNSDVNVWVKAVENAIEGNTEHVNMQKNIIEAHYDIKDVSKTIEEYYLKCAL